MTSVEAGFRLRVKLRRTAVALAEAVRPAFEGCYNVLFGWPRTAAEKAGRLAQLVEHRLYTPGVTGSSPVPPTSNREIARVQNFTVAEGISL